MTDSRVVCVVSLLQSPHLGASAIQADQKNVDKCFPDTTLSSSLPEKETTVNLRGKSACQQQLLGALFNI